MTAASRQSGAARHLRYVKAGLRRLIASQHLEQFLGVAS